MKAVFSSLVFVALSAMSIVSSARTSEIWKDANPVDWKELNQSCRSNWNQYERKLVELRQSLASELQALTVEQYNERLLLDDPKILFTQVTWPELLTDKDQFKGHYKRCADRHHEVRQALDSERVSKAVKVEAAEDFADCVYTEYTRDDEMPPLNETAACYTANARK